MKRLLPLLCAAVLLGACQPKEPFFAMRGIVLAVEDMKYEAWPQLAAQSGINTIGTHMKPKEVADFMATDQGKLFLENCRKYGIEVEHQLHAIHDLLPRELFDQDSTMFRVDERGRRSSDFNACMASERALETIASNAAAYARLLPATNHRYYFWLDDGAPTCHCSFCSQHTASEQALIAENRIIAKLRETDPQASLAHLAYLNTLEAPRRVKPAEGIFLEFAPHCRSWFHPLTDPTAEGRGMTNRDNLRYLKDNLSVFPVETAVILEYWLDVSLFSDWTKPAVELPWHKEVFLSDIATYAELGIRNITSFGVYMDSVYFENFPDAEYLKEYGEGMKSFRPAARRADTDERPVRRVAAVADGVIGVDGRSDEAAWATAEAITRYVNPWNEAVAPPTALKLLHDVESLYFLFEVEDAQIILSTTDTTEMRVSEEDRVEFFFARDPKMERYYGLEINPLGCVMDYAAGYYRNLDFSWNLAGMRTAAATTDSGYRVEGSIPLAFLREMADARGRILWGTFRGEFSSGPDGQITRDWMTWLDSNTVHPDFHLPAVLGYLTLE